MALGWYRITEAKRESAARAAAFDTTLRNLRGAGTDPMDSLYQQVSRDAEAQYAIAKRQGDPVQMCAQAGLVVAALLQEQNEVAYGDWKAIQRKDCQRAGLPE